MFLFWLLTGSSFAQSVLSGTPPIAGGGFTLFVDGAAPMAPVGFLGTLHGQGAGPCPAWLGRDCLDLVGPILPLGGVVADQSGHARLDLLVPAGVPAGTVLDLQAVEGPTGPGQAWVVTNTIRLVVSPVGSDADGDGYPIAYDCDDSDATVYPGAPRQPNTGIDHDCDGIID